MAQESASKANVSARMAPDDRALLEAVAEYNEVSLSSLARDVLTDFARAYVAEIGADKIAEKNAQRAADRAKAAASAAAQRQQRFSRAAAMVASGAPDPKANTGLGSALVVMPDLGQADTATTQEDV